MRIFKMDSGDTMWGRFSRAHIVYYIEKSVTEFLLFKYSYKIFPLALVSYFRNSKNSLIF